MTKKHIALIIAILAVYFLHNVLIILFISFLATTAFLSPVRYLQSKKIPRAISSVVLVLALVVLPASLVISMAPALINQGSELVQQIPEYIDQIEDRFGVNVNQEVQKQFEDNTERLFSNLFAVTGAVVTLISAMVIILVLTIYWLIYYETLKEGFAEFVSHTKGQHEQVNEAITAIEHRLGTWVKAQLLISTLVGLLTWVILTILGFPYAGVLALIAALLEIIPSLGPILAAVPALLVAITISPATFVIILITYIGIQQFESYVIAPRLLGHTLKLNPFIILLSLITGTHLLGIIGALIAVPFVLTVHELYLAYCKYTKKNLN